MDIKGEIAFLQQKRILHHNEDSNTINPDLHKSQLWADVFWRRRSRHEKRPDPEIPLVFKKNPQTVLEIGSAYGRVLRKLAQINLEKQNTAKLFGIELCRFAEMYFKKYQHQFSELLPVTVFFEDFFGSKSIEHQLFDVILMPMNTFPSFPVSGVNDLLGTVRTHLSEKGEFIFSTYKPLNLAEDQRIGEYLPSSYGGELLVELNEDRIAGEFYTFQGENTQFGYEQDTYMVYVTLTEDYSAKNRQIFRSSRIFYQENTLAQIISDQGYVINYIDDTSHSRVYSLSLK